MHAEASERTSGTKSTWLWLFKRPKNGMRRPSTDSGDFVADVMQDMKFARDNADARTYRNTNSPATVGCHGDDPILATPQARTADGQRQLGAHVLLKLDEVQADEVSESVYL